MRIAIDLRSLQSGQLTGVETYTHNILSRLLTQDKHNSYTLFYNKFFSSGNLNLGHFQYMNSKLVKTRYPNRILNLALMAKAIGLEKMIGEFDWLFLPNLNQYHVKPSAKVAITVHDLSPIVTPEFYNLKRRLWHKLLNFKGSLKRANVIFAVSEFTKHDLIRLFNIAPEKIKVVYPGIDSNIFTRTIPDADLREVRNRLNLPGKFILFLNTIEPRKNLSGLLKAFDLINSDASLIIAGKPGWKYRKIFQEIKSAKKFHKIKYIGYVDETDKPALFKLAKTLVYPSFYEGFGFQPLEAMAVGTPTIVSQVSALPEIAGPAALLANCYDPAALAQAIDISLTDNLLRQKLINAGYELAKKFNWDAAAGQILTYLNTL